MIKTTTIMKEDVEHHKFCDDCGVEICIGLACSKAKCGYCGKDLCEKCIGHEEESYSDYRGEIWCKQCWELGIPYRPQIESLHKMIEDLYDEWQKKCRGNVVELRKEGKKSE